MAFQPLFNLPDTDFVTSVTSGTNTTEITGEGLWRTSAPVPITLVGAGASPQMLVTSSPHVPVPPGNEGKYAWIRTTGWVTTESASIAGLTEPRGASGFVYNSDESRWDAVPAEEPYGVVLAGDYVEDYSGFGLVPYYDRIGASAEFSLLIEVEFRDPPPQEMSTVYLGYASLFSNGSTCTNIYPANPEAVTLTITGVRGKTYSTHTRVAVEHECVASPVSYTYSASATTSVYNPDDYTITFADEYNVQLDGTLVSGHVLRDDFMWDGFVEMEVDITFSSSEGTASGTWHIYKEKWDG